MKTLVVKDRATDSIIEVIGNGTERSLERTERGLNINMNHDEYYSEIIDDDDSDLLTFNTKGE